MQNSENNRYLYAGDTGIFVTFDDHDESDALLLARQLGHLIRGERQLNGVIDVTPGLKNLLIHYDPLETSFDAIIHAVSDMLDDLTPNDDGRARHWTLPVLYGGEAGPDLKEVADASGLHPDDVIKAHTDASLTVAIMGFLPGLAYMKGVHTSLYMPRKSSPRAHVPDRSVGIAMDQTVIYPLASPGGWNLIGRTPVHPFDPARKDPILFTAGDVVSFTAIDGKTFDDMDTASSHGEMVITPMEKAD